MKKLIFVSTGRCGTKRIAQILGKYLPEEFTIVHQMPFSRLGNVIGNLFFNLGSAEKLKQRLYSFIVSAYCRDKHFISSDPLTAMIIPKNYIDSADVCIVQIERDPEDFANSFFNLSRRRINSFIAHNFIPFWQIGIWPLENILNPRIKRKYLKIAKLKNSYFTETFSPNPNFKKIEMEQVFSSDFLNQIIFEHFHFDAAIPEYELRIKSN